MLQREFMKVAPPPPRNDGQPASADNVEHPEREVCPVCGSPDLFDNRCKTICRNCRTILQSCADL